MELEAQDGARPRKPALDVTNDLVVDGRDRVDTNNNGVDDNDPAASGLQSDAMISTPVIVSLGDDSEAKINVRSREDGSGSFLEITGESGGGRTGRVTWREILQ